MNFCLTTAPGFLRLVAMVVPFIRRALPLLPIVVFNDDADDVRLVGKSEAHDLVVLNLDLDLGFKDIDAIARYNLRREDLPAGGHQTAADSHDGAGALGHVELLERAARCEDGADLLLRGIEFDDGVLTERTNLHLNCSWVGLRVR